MTDVNSKHQCTIQFISLLSHQQFFSLWQMKQEWEKAVIWAWKITGMKNSFIKTSVTNTTSLLQKSSSTEWLWLIAGSLRSVWNQLWRVQARSQSAARNRKHIEKQDMKRQCLRWQATEEGGAWSLTGTEMKWSRNKDRDTERSRMTNTDQDDT